MGGFVEVPGEVDLALVVGFVPGEEEDGLADGAFDTTGEVDGAFEVGGGEVGLEGGEVVGQLVADVGEGGPLEWAGGDHPAMGWKWGVWVGGGAPPRRTLT